MSDNLVILPGVSRDDIDVEVPSAKVLRAAIEAGVGCVVVIGVAPDGEVYIAYEQGDKFAVMGRIVEALHQLAGG